MDETTRNESTINRPHDLDGRGGRVLLALVLLTGVAAPAFAADYVWNSGYYSASGFPTTIGPVDNLYITGSLINLDVTLTNNGHVYWVGGDVPSSGGHFVNHGTVMISADGSLHVYGDGALLVAAPALVVCADQARALELRAAEVVDLHASVKASHD